MAKKQKWHATPRNTPLFKEKRALVVLANGLLILNLLVIAILHPADRKTTLIGAALALAFALLTIFDKRKAQWDWTSVMIVCSLCFLLSAGRIYKTGQYLYYIGFGMEVMIFAISVIVLLKKKSSKDHKSISKKRKA